MKGRDPQPRLSTRLMIMLVAEPPPRASQRPSNHSSSHGANSNIRAARAGAGPPVSYRVTDPFHRAGHRDKTVLLRTIEKGLYWSVIKDIITPF